MKKRLLAGALGAAIVVSAAAALGIWSGVVDVSATAAHPLLDAVLDRASTRSIRRHAPSGSNPRAGDPAAIAQGLSRYRALCLACHGGPGVDAAEFAAGLHPAAPDLASAKIQAFTDGMLYRTIAQGIGSTGMPAFGPSHTPGELWSLVAFVRHLPRLTDAEKRALAAKQSRPPNPRPPNPRPPNPRPPNPRRAAGRRCIR